MRLLILEQNKWRVCTPFAEESIELIDYLENCPEDADGIFSYFERFALFGHAGFNSSQMHEVNKNESIYEFSKGNHRILFFNVEGKAIVVSCGHLKKGQKANSKEVKKAIKLKKEYLKASKSGLVKFIVEDE